MKFASTKACHHNTSGMLQTFLKCCHGAAFIEFAMVAPVLTTLLLATVDFSAATAAKMRLIMAAEAGAYSAVKNGYNTTGMTTAINGATSLTGISSVLSTYCQCANGAQVSCAATCSDSSLNATYARIALSYSLSTAVRYPTLTNPQTITYTLIARVQ